MHHSTIVKQAFDTCQFTTQDKNVEIVEPQLLPVVRTPASHAEDQSLVTVYNAETHGLFERGLADRCCDSSRLGLRAVDGVQEQVTAERAVMPTIGRASELTRLNVHEPSKVGGAYQLAVLASTPESDRLRETQNVPPAAFKLSTVMLGGFMFAIILPGSHARFSHPATHGEAVLWDGRTFIYCPRQNVVTTQACTDAGLSSALLAHIHRPETRSNFKTAYYSTSDGALLGGVDWPFTNVAGKGVAVCHTGIVAFTPACHTLCHYAVADNDFDLPEAYDVLCDALHTADGHAIAWLDLTADRAAKPDRYIHAIAALVVAAAVIVSAWALLHRPSSPSAAASQTPRV